MAPAGLGSEAVGRARAATEVPLPLGHPHRQPEDRKG